VLRILDLDFYPSRIPDPKTATKGGGGGEFVVLPFFVSQNKNLFYFEHEIRNFNTEFNQGCGSASLSCGSGYW
jgi:hypothetical protein